MATPFSSVTLAAISIVLGAGGLGALDQSNTTSTSCSPIPISDITSASTKALSFSTLSFNSNVTVLFSPFSTSWIFCFTPFLIMANVVIFPTFPNTSIGLNVNVYLYTPFLYSTLAFSSSALFAIEGASLPACLSDTFTSNTCSCGFGCGFGFGCGLGLAFVPLKSPFQSSRSFASLSGPLC